MKTLLVDMDGVLADVYAQLLKIEYEEKGIKHKIESLYGKMESEAFENGYDYVHRPGFFQTAPLIPGCVEGLQYLNDKYNLLIVSSATEFPNSPTEKLKWMHQHFPFINWKQIVLCGRKDVIKGDIMLDDHPKNLNYFEGRKIIFTQPHNIYIENPSYERANNWEEVMDIL